MGDGARGLERQLLPDLVTPMVTERLLVASMLEFARLTCVPFGWGVDDMAAGVAGTQLKPQTHNPESKAL